MEKKFSERLLELRTKNGFTQQEMADKIGISLRYYQAMEYGKNEPSLDTIMNMVKGLKIDPNQLLTGQPPQASPMQDFYELIELWKNASDSDKTTVLNVLRTKQKYQTGKTKKRE